jgi:gas vesicle protein
MAIISRAISRISVVHPLVIFGIVALACTLALVWFNPWMMDALRNPLSTELAAGLVIGGLGFAIGAIVGCGTFLLNKQKEREAKLYRLRLERYKELLEKISDLATASKEEYALCMKRFAKAANEITLVATREVIKALYELIEHLRKTKSELEKEYEEFYSALLEKYLKQLEEQSKGKDTEMVKAKEAEMQKELDEWVRKWHEERHTVEKQNEIFTQLTRAMRASMGDLPRDWDLPDSLELTLFKV